MNGAPNSMEIGSQPEPNGDAAADDRYVQLRELLIGPEQEQIEELRRRLDNPQIRSQELSETVAEAIAIRAKRDRDLQVVLQPVIEEALRISVARDPSMLADSLFPIIGEAVRKAVAHALRGMVESLNQMLDRSISAESWKWRMESWRTGKSFGEIALMRSLRYHVEQVFLIHRETGLLISHVSVSGEGIQDSDLVSSMLTAIQDFVSDSFGVKKTEELEVLEVGKFSLWLQHGPVVLLAAVVSGTPPPELRYVFERELELIHQTYAHELQAFNGDAEPLAGCRENLIRCLLGRERGVASKSYKWVWALALIVIVVGGLTFLRARENLRWKHYVQRLRTEPGIVVTDAERHWRGFSVGGLRDPLAPDPQLLLADWKIDPQDVSSHWETYLSLDAKFASARKFENDVQLLEKQVLRFGLNSSQLQTEQFVALGTVEDQIRSLEHSSEVNGRKLLIEVSGHTDRTGKEDANALLSQKRAEAVVKALRERGIPGSILAASGVGDRNPEHLGAESYPEELDRRVTFHVVTENK
jgi:outer membrane protein OmpA-like peptidoglycan-associated protein